MSYTDQDSTFLDDTLRAWVNGWSLSRATPPALEVAERGFRIDVGQPDHVVRYVFPGHDLSAVAAQVHSMYAAGTWLKVCAPQAAISSLLPSRWVIKPPEYLMRIRMQALAAQHVPDGYELIVHGSETILDAVITATDKQPAARGRMALFKNFAIFDQVVTEVAHQRKGLGKFIMNTLMHHAVSKDADHGVLVASEDGYKLYRTIGWNLLSPMTAAVIPATTTSISDDSREY